MDDNYPTLLTWAFWVCAICLTLFAILCLTPVGNEVEDRPSAVAVFLLFAAVAWGLGYISQGSRSADELRDANRRVNEAQIAFDDADRDYNALMADRAIGDGDASKVASVAENMSFERCLARIREMSQTYGVPANLTETTEVRSVRFPVSDGSVLVTCSRPDQKMILTRSPHR